MICLRGVNVKNYRWAKPLFISLAIIVPLIIIVVMAANDLGALFNSWESQEATPDWIYVYLILFKLAIYIIPPCIAVWGIYIPNKDRVDKNKFWHYSIKTLNWHFLILLVIKLIADAFLELDDIYGLTLFNSINDVQTLIGYIITLLLRQNIKINPGVDKVMEIANIASTDSDCSDGDK